MIQEERSIGSIINNITEEDLNKIDFYLKWFYHKNKPLSRQLKVSFQKCKIIEEIGELGQAIALGKTKPVNYKKYDEVRGTIESEMADVCIAVLGYLRMTGKTILVFENTTPVAYDEEILMFKLIRYVADEYFCKLFNLICSFAIDNGIDILYNIKERIKFNNEWALRYRDGLKKTQGKGRTE